MSSDDPTVSTSQGEILSSIRRDGTVVENVLPSTVSKEDRNPTTSTSEGEILFTLRRDGTVVENMLNSSVSKEDRDETETDSPTDTSEDKHIILCLLWKYAKLGAAYYDTRDKQLYMYNDIIDYQPSYIITKAILNEINPRFVIVVGNLTDHYIKSVIEILSNNEETIDSVQMRALPSNMALVSFKEYSYSACEYKIFSLRLPSEPTNATESEREFFLQSLIDFTNKQSIHALGVLIKYTEIHWSYLYVDDVPLEFRHINPVTMQNHLYMDKNTFDALHIFKVETHDSSFKRGGMQSFREGFSVYKLISQYCQSSVGYFQARKLLSSPINDISKLNERLNFIEFIINPPNTGFIEGLHDHLRKISDINHILETIQHSRATSKNWITLYKTIYHILFIHESCRPYINKCEILSELNDAITENLYGLENSINSAMDFKESATTKWPVVKFGVDTELDAKKLKQRDVRKSVTAAANFTVYQLPANLEECVVTYVPETGYLVTVKEWEPNCDPFELESIGFQFLFAMKGILHYKNAMCKELDAQFGNIHLDIIAHENRIFQRLCTYVLKYSNDIREPLKIIGLMDCLLSMAKVSKEKGYIRPKLNTNNVYEITDCRHPLMELFLETYVPNDYFSGGSHTHLKIITGPNASGKSVYLKQIGLMIYLAHIGMYLPAKEANIGITYSIHSRIHASESAALRLSAFMIDLSQMSQALNSAKPSSLVMIDEFGKGTTGREGIALQAGALGKFLQQEEFCPHVLVSTHVQEICNFLPTSDLISHMRMDHTQNNNQFVYLYKLVNGISSSFALDVAAMAGLDESIVKRAREILTCLQSGTPIKPLPQLNQRYHSVNMENLNDFLRDVDIPTTNEN